MSTVDTHENIDDIDFPANLEPIRLLGRGSMGGVYLARDRTLKRMVAIKVLRSELCEIERSRKRFEREAQAAARLSHDGITTVYSVGRNNEGRPYIEMEYIEGVNLEDLLHSHGPFDVAEACRILRQLAAALAAAHDQNVVHRDVRPANILISNASGAATLTDFGLAAILQTGDNELSRLTREGECLGDPRYMSPEQLRGEPLTGQSDIYNLGVLAFELLAGSGPFDDAEITDIAAAHIRRPPPDLVSRRPDVPQWLSDIVRRCLAKKPERRPRAKDLADLLDDPTGAKAKTLAAPSTGPISSFLHELKQRKVYQAAAAYAAITFVLLQVVDLLLQPWPQLNIVYQLTVIACIAGFPITIVLAWIYDLRSGRLIRTDQDSTAVSALPDRRRRIVILGLVVSVAIALAAAWVLFK